MEKLIFLFIFSASVVFSTIRADSFNVENYSDADRLFSWAERTHPTLFSPANGTSQVWENWYYRYYSDTKNYVGVNTDSFVYVTGKSFDGLLHIDTLEMLLTEVDKKPVITGRLNDTGITICGTNSGLCNFPKTSGSDAQYGRDATNNDHADGYAGFSFTKLDKIGKALPAAALDWTCIKDNVTGLIWEVKTSEEGLRYKGHKYSWYNPTGINDGGEAGSANGNNTDNFIHQINKLSLCGANNWRLPTKIELLGLIILDPSEVRLHSLIIDSDYFPNTMNGFYWSSTPSKNSSSYALGIYFRDDTQFSIEGSKIKMIEQFVRLVHSE